jgi:hypothetical protein
MAPEDPSIISPTRPTRISGIFPDSTGTGEEAPVSPGGLREATPRRVTTAAYRWLLLAYLVAVGGASVLILVLAWLARAGRGESG